MNETEPTLPRLPFPIMAAALIAMGTLLIIGKGALPLAYVYIAALLAAYFVPARIENNSPVRWFIRIGYIGAAYATSRLFEASGGDYALLPSWMRNFFGLVYGGEMVLQVWRYVRNNPRAPLAVLFFSGFVFLTASNTFDESLIRYSAPVYIFSLILGLRSYQSEVFVRSASTAATRRTRSFSVLLRGGAVAIALLSGFVLFRIFYEHRGDLTELGNKLIGQHLQDSMESALMAEQPSLGRTFGLRGSPMRVLRITGTEGYIGDPHLRGMAFDSYKDGLWGPEATNRNYVVPDRDRDLRLPTGLNDPPVGLTSIVQVTRLVRGNPLIYAPLNVSDVDLTDATRVRWSPDTGGPIRTSQAPPFTYTLSIPANERIQGVLAQKLTPELKRQTLELPEKLDPRVRALALDVIGKATRPRDKIEAVVTYLLSHHQYSLTVVPGPGDPVTNFLLSSPPKDAHCEYFAASAAVLLRCVGVPTRYVTGYYVHESDGDNTSIVRQRDAHAWTEAWVSPVGWVTVDATPGNGRPDFQPEPIAKGQAFWERIQDAFQSVRDWIGDLKPEQINLIVGSLTLITLLGGAVFLVVRRRRAVVGDHLPAFDAYMGADERLAALAARFEREMARQGAAFPSNRTWQEHLTSLTNSVTESRPQNGVPLAKRFVGLYERARFGTLLRETSDAEAAMNAMQDLLIQMESLSAETESQRPDKGTPTPAA